jgi:hypothetical protein
MDNIPLFIERVLRRGNCISLNDVDYSISENTFWVIEFFEEYCRNLFFSFKKGFTLKLERKIAQISQADILYFHQALSSNFTPYQNVLDQKANSYQQFIRKKLQHLNRNGLLDEASRLDKENRGRLLIALKGAMNKKSAKDNSEIPYSNENYDNLPFTEMLNLVEDSRFKTKEIIQDYL